MPLLLPLILIIISLIESEKITSSKAQKYHDLQCALNNLAIAKTQNSDYTLPRIDILFTLPEFANMKAFVQCRRGCWGIAGWG
ncbi:MAG: hypothetical protein VSS52_005040 [Thiotrichaceae bacterium]|nr:hypothetical protein [Thiotrichaceae bacterium]